MPSVRGKSKYQLIEIHDEFAPWPYGEKVYGKVTIKVPVPPKEKKAKNQCLSRSQRPTYSNPLGLRSRPQTKSSPA